MVRPVLKDYQQRAVFFSEKNSYCILALDPGLGKSRCAIEVRENHQCNCLIVCPGYLALNWVKEIKKWSDTPDVQISVFNSGKKIYCPVDSDYVIVSYDLAQKADFLFEWADMIVLDEGHYIKSMDTKRTQFIHKNIYENSVPRVIILTGTPIKNRVKEYYSLMAVCHYDPRLPDPEFLERWPTEIDFADYFSHREEYTMEINNKFVTILKWTGFKNVKELKKQLRGVYFRIKSSDVLDLPPVSYKSVHVSDWPDNALLNSFNTFFLEEGRDSVNPTAKAEAALKKVPFTVKYALDLLEEAECVLIYSDHVASAEAIAKELGVKAITGKITSSVRSKMADEFQAGKGRVLVATVGSMKEGKDLFRANHIIFNDYPWVPGDIKQVIHRIQRVGQKSPCTVHRILGSPQDDYIVATLEEKIRTIEKVT